MKKKVVITGMGVVSPVGNGLKDFWEGLKTGTYGIAESNFFPPEMFSKRLYGSIKNFDFRPYRDFKHRIGRASAFAITAAEEALKQAGLQDDNRANKRMGVVIGTLAGENAIRETPLLRNQKYAIQKGYYPFFLTPLVSQNVARWFSITGPNSTISTACSSSGYALEHGCRIIENGLADIVIIGGVESFSAAGQGTFIRINSLDSEKIRPFDKNRKGTIIGEGAGVLIIESEESAQNRGADIFAVVKGIGLSCDGYHESAPEPEGLQIINAMKRALEEASLLPEEIDCISVHGTGTIYNDKVETKVIKVVFAHKAKSLSLTAIKSMLGHGVGAACSVAVIGAVMMMENNLVVPTINYQDKDPDCDLDYTVNKSRSSNLKNVMINSYGFGGNNISIIVSKPE